MFRLVAKALGEKTGSTDSEANKVAFIRACIMLQVFVTNIFIITGIIRHW